MDTGTWLNIGKRSMKYIVAWTMFLDQAIPISISFLIHTSGISQSSWLDKIGRNPDWSWRLPDIPFTLQASPSLISLSSDRKARSG